MSAETTSREGKEITAGGDFTTVYFNCRVLQADGELQRGELWTQGGKIVSPPKNGKGADKAVDCRNAIVCPGFIDLQVNGAFGVDFLTTPDLPEALQRVNEKMPSTGVTLYAPTLITSPPEYFHQTLPNIPPTLGSAANGAGVIGVHCEGPFIAKEKKGAHPVEFISDFQGRGFAAVADMYGSSLDNVRIVTLAPEYAQSLEVIAELRARGVVVSLGHSITSLDRALEAVQAGATMITHLFNAMPSFHHRDPSLPGLLAAEAEIRAMTKTAADSPAPKVYFGLISDGIHTHETALRLAHRLAPDRLVLVTDALAPMGLGCGDYRLGKQEIEVRGSPPRATVKDTETLCGCVATMSDCVRHFQRAVGCSLGYALTAATLHPARCMGIDNRKGALLPGMDADFLLLDDDVRVLRAYIAGELAWSDEGQKVLVEEEQQQRQP